MTLEHGGDLFAAQQVYSGEILDFSVNINPLGPAPQALEAARAALERAGEYPDPLCRALRQAIAARDGVQPEQVLCGNGAAEVIFRLALALRPRAALLTAPTFAEYEGALRQVGCDCRFHLLREDVQFDVTEEILGAIEAPIELVVLCSPHNPTGRVIAPALLEKILARCRVIGARLLLDECFLPLAQAGPGMAPYLAAWPELFLLRAFTKTYGLPALRLGYGLGEAALVERMLAWGPCWNVSGPAQAAGLACCQLPQWPSDGRALAASERPRLLRGLAALGCRVIPGSANYLLFCLPGVFDLKERLLRQGVLLRSCANYRGLGPDWYRVAVRQAAENETLLRALGAALED